MVTTRKGRIALIVVAWLVAWELADLIHPGLDVTASLVALIIYKGRRGLRATWRP